MATVRSPEPTDREERKRWAIPHYKAMGNPAGHDWAACLLCREYRARWGRWPYWLPDAPAK